MKILPMDIQRQSFGTKFRGFDPEEVRGYLTIVAEEVAAIQGDRDRLDALARLRSQRIGPCPRSDIWNEGNHDRSCSEGLLRHVRG